MNRKINLIIILFASLFIMNVNAEVLNGLISDGQYTYYYINGVKQKGFQKIDGKTYFFSRINNNEMRTGTFAIDGPVYHFNNDGTMLTGWYQENGQKYYFDTEGRRAKGFQKIDGKTYFFSRINNNEMRTGTIVIDGKTYIFNSDGSLRVGWYTENNKKYYYDEQGQKVKGFQKIDGKTYFFSRINNNEMRTGFIKIDNDYYYFDDSTGIMKTGYIEIDGTEKYFKEDGKLANGITTMNGKKFFFKDGIMQWGFQKENGNTYFFTRINDHSMRTGFFMIDGYYYYFEENTGKMQLGFKVVEGIKRFFSRVDGKMRTGWVAIDGSMYYFDTNTGEMATGTKTIDGVEYKFNSNGSVISQWIRDSQGTKYLFANGKYANDWVHIEGGKHFFNSLGYLIAKNARKVIDVSSHNGTINWDKVKNQGDIDAVILRISAGCQNEDTKLSYNIENLKRLNIPYGVYIYSYAENENEGKLYAQFTKKVLDKYSMNPTYGVYFDLENNSTTEKLKPADYDKIVKGFMNYMAGTKYKSVTRIYTYKSFAETKLTSSYTKQYIYWMAQYYHYCTYNGSYKAWQYSSTETLPGISGNVDMSVWF